MRFHLETLVEKRPPKKRRNHRHNRNSCPIVETDPFCHDSHSLSFQP